MTRSYEGEEALRWKRKFLDALEEHERREKQLNHRIRLLRRGLLGISLAGDGHDPQLDRQLADLRKTLRQDDRDTGLEMLLEKIEQSVIRLDNEKSQSNLALQQAFTASLAELEKLPLPGSLRRQLKKFSRNLNVRLDDPQQHNGLIRQFMELLREAVQAMLAEENKQAASSTEGGFWRRIFKGHDDAASSIQGQVATTRTDATVEDVTDEHASRTRVNIGLDRHEDETRRSTATRNRADDTRHDDDDPVSFVFEREVFEREQPASDADLIVDAEATEEPDEIPRVDLADVVERDEAEIREAEAVVTLEGEVLRDRSGLQEPAFSYIAGHVEPLLLRILETVHISEESFAIADALRRTIVKGLNWYDFVAVLEEILHILQHAANDQRAQFQDFLSDVTESLAQVQVFVDQARQHADDSAQVDDNLDSAVRAQIETIRQTIQSEATDLPTLKQSLQAQMNTIIQSLDGFREQRQSGNEQLEQEMQQLMTRIAALEQESRELKFNLAQQQEAAATDTLTELPNRDTYQRRLATLLQQWREGAAHDRREDDRELCLAVADVDHFKQINDSYGHLAGDKVLKIIAREMAARLRDKDFVARYGGEEFVIILPETRPADAEHVLNKLRQAIGAIPFHFKEQKVEITVSFGMACARPQDGPETLFERADQALYKAKQEGRNCVVRAR